MDTWILNDIRIIGKRSFDWCYLIYQRLAVHQACDPKLHNHLSSIIIVKRTSTTNHLSRRNSGRPPVKHLRCWCPQLLAWYWYLWFYKGNDSNLPISRISMAVYFWAMAIQRLRRLRVNKDIILMTARKTSAFCCGWYSHALCLYYLILISMSCCGSRLSEIHWLCAMMVIPIEQFRLFAKLMFGIPLTIPYQSYQLSRITWPCQISQPTNV